MKDGFPPRLLAAGKIGRDFLLPENGRTCLTILSPPPENAPPQVGDVALACMLCCLFAERLVLRSLPLRLSCVVVVEVVVAFPVRKGALMDEGPQVGIMMNPLDLLSTSSHSADGFAENTGNGESSLGLVFLLNGESLRPPPLLSLHPRL